MSNFPIRYGIIRFPLVCVIACARPLHSLQWVFRKGKLISNENICSLCTQDFYLVSWESIHFFSRSHDRFVYQSILSSHLILLIIWFTGVLMTYQVKAHVLCQELILPLHPNNKTKLTVPCSNSI